MNGRAEMNTWKLSLVGILVAIDLINCANDGLNMVCYYKLEKVGDVTRLQPELIDPFLCTHLIVAFATVQNNTLQPYQPKDLQIYRKVLDLKKKNRKLKVLLSAGGGGSPAQFSTMVQTSENRAQFIQQSVEFLAANGFDGLDLDWEFPAWQGDAPQDRDLFVLFLKEFRASVGPDFLLSVDVAQMEPLITFCYDVPQMAELVSFINIMCYDFHVYKSFFRFTGHNSPLYQRSIEKGYFATLNTNFSVHYWIEKGMPANKINAGIPTYGNTFKLLDAKWTTFDAPSTGPGIFGGGVDTHLVCLFNKNGGQEVFDVESQVPYSSHDLDWISYENERSISVKGAYAAHMGLAGVMTFNLNCDDWSGSCDGKTTFPLHKAIKNSLKLTSTNHL